MKRYTKSFLYRFSRRDGEEPAKSRQNSRGLGEPSITFNTAMPRNPVLELGKLDSCYDLAEWCNRWQD